MADELFCKRLPMTLKSSDREDRKVHIQVAVEIHTTSNPTHSKELIVRLTDENDLFFLYTLQLGEEDFQSLKTQQGLLVDFSAFPQRFIDLLNMVLQEEHREAPKFILDLVCLGASGIGGSTAVLNVIETNPFKHLTHLALKFLPGTDSDVKKYLADCLKTLKDQNCRLLERFEHTEGDLSGQLRAAREALAARTTELDHLKAEWTNKLSTLSANHQQEMSSEREKALVYQTDAQQRYDREKRDMEQMHSKSTKQLENRLYELEANNKDLTDRRYKSEATIRELRSKLGLLEEEHQRTKAEVQALRKNNSGLDADYHEQDKLLHQLRTRLAVLEQELKDKDELLRKTAESVSTEKEQRKKVEEECEHEKRRVTELKVSLKTMTEELTKGNEIIKKLQNEIKNYHAKLKLRNQITTEQEKLLGEKNSELEEIRRELNSTKTSLQNKEDENSKLNERLETTVQKLDESRQLLKTNENVIQWLNKQVTENQLHQYKTSTGFQMNSMASTLPSSSSVAQRHYRPQYHLSDIHNDTTGTVNTAEASYRHPVTPYTKHQPEQVHYQPGAARKTGLPLPVAKSSPVDTIREEGEVDSQHTTHNSEPQLDTKYFQPSKEAPLRGTTSQSASSLYLMSAPTAANGTSPPGPSKAIGRHPAPLPAGRPPASTAAQTLNRHTLTSGGLSHQHVRLSKELVAPRTVAPHGVRHSQQTPALASAYFNADAT